MNTRKVGTIGSGLLLIFLLLGASFAWACTAQPYIQISPKSGEPGTIVDVNGNGFGEGRVEIRWGSAGGEKLGEASGPSFSVPMKVPDVSPGVYYVLAMAKGLTGEKSNNFARDSFEVLPAKAGPQPAQGAPSSSNDSPSSSGTERQSSGSPAQGGSGGGSEPQSQNVEAAPVLDTASSGSSEAAGRPNQNAGSVGAGGPDGGGPATIGSGGGPEDGTGIGGAEASGANASSEASRSFARTVSQDLWSGFEKATLSPGLIESQPEAGSSRPDLVLGITVFSAGVLALLGGLVALEGRRRQSLADITHRR